MKGFALMNLIVAIIIILLTAAIAFVYWKNIESGVSGKPLALLGLAFFAPAMKSRRGFMTVTNLLIAVVMILVAVFIILSIWYGISGQAGHASDSILYGIQDALLGRLP